MDNYDDLKAENRELRKQLVELAKHMRDVQDTAIEEDLSIELEALLRAVPVSLLHPSPY